MKKQKAREFWIVKQEGQEGKVYDPGPAPMMSTSSFSDLRLRSAL
jgi:hypothetical protein